MHPIPADRQAALKELGLKIGLTAPEPTVVMKGFRISEADHRVWIDLAQVHQLNASKTLAVMIDAYLAAHDEDFRPWSGPGAVLPVRFGRYVLPRRLIDILERRCKTHRVSASDCMRQVINWTTGLID